ncbi:uncharacterized protein VTP21DRAFT_7116 [Calcarisporiella thermophila]|uniref:uncharacterized protein n=1 Tax=Calcarisporiella thermophila TaxID=911321 RepID=UPI0037445F46
MDRIPSLSRRPAHPRSKRASLAVPQCASSAARHGGGLGRRGRARPARACAALVRAPAGQRSRPRAVLEKDRFRVDLLASKPMPLHHAPPEILGPASVTRPEVMGHCGEHCQKLGQIFVGISNRDGCGRAVHGRSVVDGVGLFLTFIHPAAAPLCFFPLPLSSPLLSSPLLSSPASPLLARPRPGDIDQPIATPNAHASSLICPACIFLFISTRIPPSSLFILASIAPPPTV